MCLSVSSRAPLVVVLPSGWRLVAGGVRKLTDERRYFDAPPLRKKAFLGPRSFSQNPYFCPAIIPESLSVLFCSTLYICLLYKQIPW